VARYDPAHRSLKDVQQAAILVSAVILEQLVESWAETASAVRGLKEAGFRAVGCREALADVTTFAVLARAFHHAEPDQERIAVPERVDARLVVPHAARLKG
jgi:hypothetical protein